MLMVVVFFGTTMGYLHNLNSFHEVIYGCSYVIGLIDGQAV